MLLRRVRTGVDRSRLQGFHLHGDRGVLARAVETQRTTSVTKAVTLVQRTPRDDSQVGRDFAQRRARRPTPRNARTLAPSTRPAFSTPNSERRSIPGIR